LDVCCFHSFNCRLVSGFHPVGVIGKLGEENCSVNKRKL
jgi:hypothetical protein